MSKDRPWGNGTPVHFFELVTDDSDRTYTVPVGKCWLMVLIAARLNATATVGNRLFSVLIASPGVPIASSPSVTVAASQVGIIKMYGSANYTTTVAQVPWGTGTVGNAAVQIATPAPLILPAGSTIRAYDSAAIDAAADDMNVVLSYVEYDA